MACDFAVGAATFARLLHGGVCVVDGVERLSEGLLSSLQRLCVDRELSLYDGGLLLHPARFDAACWAP